MKAIVYKQYGPPEVATLQDIPKPKPKADELLIKVYASTVNRTDSGFRSANYVVSRLWSGIFKPKKKVLGCEFAGTIEEIGSKVSGFHLNERVFGYDDDNFGGHAQYLCIKQDKAIEKIPKNFSFIEAAPIAEGAHYAWCIIKAAQLTAGQSVMVYGATGGIGSAAVQLLKTLKVDVTAVCGTKHTALVKSLGADFVIDYEIYDIYKINQKFDFILDAVGKLSFSKCKVLLNPKGIYASTELGKNGANIFLALFTPFFGSKKVIFPIPSMQKNDLSFFKKLIEDGAYKPIIDVIYNLEQIVEAYTYVDSGSKIGNVVLKIH